MISWLDNMIPKVKNIDVIKYKKATTLSYYDSLLIAPVPQ